MLRYHPLFRFRIDWSPSLLEQLRKEQISGEDNSLNQMRFRTSKQTTRYSLPGTDKVLTASSLRQHAIQHACLSYKLEQRSQDSASRTLGWKLQPSLHQRRMNPAISAPFPSNYSTSRNPPESNTPQASTWPNLSTKPQFIS